MVAKATRPGLKADLNDISTRLYRLERRAGGGGGGAGPTGPTGPAGPTGATGATGATGGGGTTIYGNTESISIGSSGQVSVTHGIGSTPSQVVIMLGSNPSQTYSFQNLSKNSTTFTFRVRDASTGANILSGTTINVDWIARV